jgi:hypothetical protein
MDGELDDIRVPARCYLDLADSRVLRFLANRGIKNFSFFDAIIGSIPTDPIKIHWSGPET